MEWLRPLRDWVLGRCQRIPQPEGEALACLYRDKCLELQAVAVLLSTSRQTVLWTACAPLAMLAQLFWVDLALHSSRSLQQILARVPELLQHFALFAGWRSALAGHRLTMLEAHFYETLQIAETKVVGKLRGLLAEHRYDFGRCDTCCSDAACPHEEQTSLSERPSALCPADTRFDAFQDVRDRLWSRAASVLDAIERQADRPARYPADCLLG